MFRSSPILLVPMALLISSTLVLAQSGDTNGLGSLQQLSGVKASLTNTRGELTRTQAQLSSLRSQLTDLSARESSNPERVAFDSRVREVFVASGEDDGEIVTTRLNGFDDATGVASLTVEVRDADGIVTIPVDVRMKDVQARMDARQGSSEGSVEASVDVSEARREVAADLRNEAVTIFAETAHETFKEHAKAGLKAAILGH